MTRLGTRQSIGLLVLVTAVAAGTAVPGRSQASRPKARRQLATWLVYNQEKGFDRIQRYADIIDSLSVFGNPPRDFIDRCHALGIVVYRAVSGNRSAFETPAQAEATLAKYLEFCRDEGYDGIDLDFEHLDPGLQDRYSEFLRQVSTGLHKADKKLSHCVGFYPGMEQNPPRKIFYDPKVVAATCDMIRVMCYDLYWAPGRGDPKMESRADTQGIGPTSNYPWAREAMRFWLANAPREKLIMGLPAYSNDYALSPTGRGRQIYDSVPPAPADHPAQKSWLWYERLAVYLYYEPDGTPHIFYASDAESTRAHLETVDELDLPGIGFWHFSSVDETTWGVVREWMQKR